MWNKTYPKSWGRLFERYCDEYLPGRKEEICLRADKEYKRLQSEMPDLGGKENGMADNMGTWGIKINPDNRTEGYSFHLIGCPIAKHAKEHGYEELLPYLCKTDHSLAHVLHAKLIRTQIEILGGDYCDYWYVGDKSEAAKAHADLEEI